MVISCPVCKQKFERGDQVMVISSAEIEDPDSRWNLLSITGGESEEIIHRGCFSERKPAEETTSVSRNNILEGMEI